MDTSSELTLHLLSALLPPHLVEYISTYLLHPDAPLQIYKRKALLHAGQALEAIQPIVQPFIDKIFAIMAENQGLVGLAVSLAVVTVTLVILNWVRRLVLWWTRLTLKIAMLFAMVAMGAWIWERGVFDTAREVFVLGGKITGYMAVLKDVWLDEYSRYEEQQAMGSARVRNAGR